MKKPGSN